MNKELTFNDLPMVVAQLRDEVVGMKQMIISLQSQNKPHKANTHIPMSVEEASAYLKMPMAYLDMLAFLKEVMQTYTQNSAVSP